MTLLKRLLLCLGLSMLLVACNSDQNAPVSDDPALTSGTPAATAPTATNACSTAPDPGPCKASIEKYYFDSTTKKCTTFNYGGCQGTVPFETMDSCKSACETQTSAANGCVVNGVEYNMGESWSQACNTCTCTNTDNGPTSVCTNMTCDTTNTDTITTPQDRSNDTGTTVDIIQQGS